METTKERKDRIIDCPSINNMRETPFFLLDPEENKYFTYKGFQITGLFSVDPEKIPPTEELVEAFIERYRDAPKDRLFRYYIASYLYFVKDFHAINTIKLKNPESADILERCKAYHNVG